jgi:hypothetical protein
LKIYLCVPVTLWFVYRAVAGEKMFILDSLMIGGIRWALETALTAAEAEMNDDSVLREQLLEAEMRREIGEISDEQFQEIEGDLLARIREIKERREGAGPLAFGGAHPMETTGDSTFQVEASVSGDFYDPATAPHTTVIESTPRSGEEVSIINMEPGDAAPPNEAAPRERSDRSVRSKPSARSTGKTRSAVAAAAVKRAPRTTGTTRTKRTIRTTRTARTSRTNK